VDTEEAYLSAAGGWHPFIIRAEDGTVHVRYGRSGMEHTVEAPPPRDADWRTPKTFEVYLGGRTSGREARVDNLRFVAE
jgi:hypothetical protein